MSVVCIAGMHRSGTSMVARALNLCGLYLGEESEILPAASDNIDGYWENIYFLGINERILTSLQAGWDLPPDAASGWENLPEIAVLQQEAQKCVQRMAHHQHWGWKDPRNSLTLPFWRQLIPDLKVLICLRDPYEVARSLARRGLSSEMFSMRLWQTYYERLLAAAPSQDLLVTHYDAFLHDGQGELRRVLAFLEITADEQMMEEAGRAIHSSSKHQRASFADTPGAASYPQVSLLYSNLCTQSGPLFQETMQTPTDRDQNAPAEAAAQDQKDVPAPDNTKLVEDLQGRILRNAFTIESLQQGLAERDQHVQSLQGQLDTVEDLQGRIWRNAFTIESLQQGLAERDQHVQSLQGQLDTIAASLAERDGQVQALNGQLHEIRISRAWRAAQWLQRIRAFLLPRGSLRARSAKALLSFLHIPFTLRRNYKMRGDLALIRKSDLFNREWYLAHNPDVAEAKVDPVLHYLLHGGFEDRDPGPDFSSKRYLDTYQDVRQAGINPLIHYLRFGLTEGRSGLPSVPPISSAPPVVVAEEIVPVPVSSRPRSLSGDVQSISFYSHSDADALGYLRLLGPAKQAGLEIINGVKNGRIDIERVAEGDVVVIQRDFPADLADYEQILAIAHRQGKPVILELDDLLLELPEDHPDRQTGRYAKALLPILQALTEVDLVTVATRPLREYVLPYNQNVVVLPNYFNDDIWRLRPPVPFVAQKDMVVIGYMGGNTHVPDLDMIAPSLLELDRRHPGKLLFRFWGVQPPSALRTKPNVQWFASNSSTYPAFAEYFQRQAADIFIAPLRDNLFNICKSPIKYFEYSALGAPGVFSRIAAYSNVIEDGFNGLLASSLSDWTEALNQLVEDPELRLTIARNAQENIRSNWLLSNNAARWLEAYKIAIELASHEKPPTTAFQTLVRSLTRQIVEVQDKDTPAVNREQELAEIERSQVWQIAVQLRHIRLRLAPPGSLRARIARTILSSHRASDAGGDLNLINNSKLFDAPWYLANNPDVAKSGMNPALHYLQFGGLEGRDPGTKFSSSWYLAAYKDVEETRINPLIHYLKYGRKEGRSALPEQSAQGHRSFAHYLTSAYLIWKAEGFRGIGRRLSWGLDKMYSTWKQGGTRLVWQKVRWKLDRPISGPYHPLLTVPVEAVLSEDEQRQEMENFHFKPLISILMPVYNTPPRYLAAAIDSIRRQAYTNFEICICDDGSSNSAVATELKRISAQDQRIKLFTFRKNSGISVATNKAAELANGDFYALMDHDDELTPNALFEVVRMLNQDPLTDVIYSDQDKIDTRGLLSEPFCKPDWSPEYFRGAMYVGHLLVVKNDLFHQVGGMLSRFDGVQDYEFMLRVSEIAKRIRHISKILYHWRKIPGSIALSVDEKGDRIEELQVKAVEEQLQRLGIPATVTINPSQRHRVIILPKPRLNFPLVSIIVLARKFPQDIERCVRSIFQRTSYPNYEVVVVANRTTDKTSLEEMINHPVKVVASNDELSSARASNLGLQNAQGEFVVLLDSDVEVVTVEWIEVLLSYLEREEVGAVGPMLIYPNHTVQHAGIALGIHGTADNLMRHFPYVSDGYAGSLCCPREVSAVTGACMMLKRQDYVELGGLVEHYATQYQDVDLCLRILKTGKRILYVPHAVLIRYEGHTKGKVLDDHMDRALFLDIWGETIARGDPYYNPHFSLEAGDYSFRRKGGV